MFRSMRCIWSSCFLAGAAPRPPRVLPSFSRRGLRGGSSVAFPSVRKPFPCRRCALHPRHFLFPEKKVTKETSRPASAPTPGRGKLPRCGTRFSPKGARTLRQSSRPLGRRFSTAWLGRLGRAERGGHGFKTSSFRLTRPVGMTERDGPVAWAVPEGRRGLFERRGASVFTQAMRASSAARPASPVRPVMETGRTFSLHTFFVVTKKVWRVWGATP